MGPYPFLDIMRPIGKIWLPRIVFWEADRSVWKEKKIEMTKSEINKFKKILETKQGELERVVRNRDAIAIEKSADALDEVQHASERELAIRNLDRESNLLRNVRLALRRIDDGSFGTCLHCEEEISPKRIAAVPWAANCIQCQELADRNKEDGNEAFDDELVSHAA
jgi:DnaK suppressor protein